MINRKKKATHTLTLNINNKLLSKSRLSQVQSALPGIQNKRSQEQKSKIFVAKPKKKAQEEMVGFALIVIIVAVIMLIFLAISLRKGGKELVESYKVEGFINALLQYNTECEDKSQRPGFISVRDLILDCYEERKCLDGSDSCDVLNDTLQGLISASWKIGENTPLKGYLLNITEVDGEGLRGVNSFEVGNKTYNAWGSYEELPYGVKVMFIAYY